MCRYHSNPYYTGVLSPYRSSGGVGCYIGGVDVTVTSGSDVRSYPFIHLDRMVVGVGLRCSCDETTTTFYFLLVVDSEALPLSVERLRGADSAKVVGAHV